MELNYKKIGSGQPLVILHGLFGSLDNWQTLGKKFGEDYEVYLVDLRNHGKSPHSNAFSYELMADDLYQLFRELHLHDVILLGHSMGGKVAIMFAQKYPHLLEKLIVADIGVKGYPMHHEEILKGLNAVKPEERKGRREAHEVISEYIDEEGIRQFLLKNLYWREKGKMAWRFNLPVLENEMEEIISALPDTKVSVPTLFIRGEKSNYILESDFDDLNEQFPNAVIRTIEGAGHWLHAEDPKTFYAQVTEFIESD